MFRANEWKTLQVGGGGLVRSADGLRFVGPPTDARRYANAQVDNYRGLPRSAFLCRPPLTLTVRARFSHASSVLLGTAGFGFWNDPFLMTEFRLPALPRALWFFYASPPSDMALALDVPGWGWKAATIDASHPHAAGMLASAPFLAPAMHRRSWHRRLWPSLQRAFHICEASIAVPLTEWHTYVLLWAEDSVRFHVDGAPVLTSPFAIPGPLGLVVWLDNQYMVVRPTGELRHGVIGRTEVQWMEISALAINV